MPRSVAAMQVGYESLTEGHVEGWKARGVATPMSADRNVGSRLTGNEGANNAGNKTDKQGTLY